MTTKTQSIAGQQAETIVGVSSALPAVSPELMAQMFATFMQQMMQQQGATATTPPQQETPNQGLQPESWGNTFADLADAYMQQWQGRDRSRATRLGFWVDKVGHLTLKELNTKVIRQHLLELEQRPAKKQVGKDCDGEFIMKTRGHGLAGATVNRFMMCLSAVLRWAIGAGWTPEEYANPCSRIPSRKEGKPRDRVLSPDEQKRLLYAAEGCRWPLMWAIIRIGLSTGARRGEISGLRWENVDLDKGIATFPMTKNGQARTIPLLPDVCEFLRPWERKTGFVFHSNKRPSKPMLFEGIWQDCLADAGLKGTEVVFHSLRHSCITTLVASKANIIQIQKLVGHSSPQMVSRYTHQSDEEKTELVLGVFANGTK